MPGIPISVYPFCHLGCGYIRHLISKRTGSGDVLQQAIITILNEYGVHGQDFTWNTGRLQVPVCRTPRDGHQNRGYPIPDEFEDPAARLPVAERRQFR